MWNYFTIKWLSEILKIKIANYKIGEVFSQNKNEIIFGFYKENLEDFYWILNFSPSFPHMRFAKQYSRAKKNSVDLFSNIIDSRIEKLIFHEGERSFHFELEEGQQLIFKLHGGRSNVILKKVEEISLFRTSIKSDSNFSIPGEKVYSIPEEIINYEKELKSHFPVFDKVTITFLQQENFFKSDLEKRKSILKKTLDQLTSKNIYLYHIEDKWLLHPIPLEKEAEKYSDLLEAINAYSSLESKARYISVQKSKVLKEFGESAKKIKGSIQKMTVRLESLISNNEWEETANLIMANLHQFKENNESAEVYDFYNDSNKIIKIKKGVSPQKYAETLYKKSKNKGIEIDNLEASISNNESRLKQLEQKISDFKKLDDPKEIKAWLGKEKSQIKSGNKEKETQFKEFRIGQFDIYVGKNAKNNDLLTTKFAKKDDLWMHAKDVSGSHLVIRKDKNTKIPTDVLEKAASIAAWYSKGKNDTLFPVIYTERKYVRKGKGLAAGQVFVDKYDVLIVKPELP